MNIFDKRPLSLILCILLGGFVFFSLGETIIRILLIACAVILYGITIYLHSTKRKNYLIPISALALTLGIIFSHVYFSFIFNPFDKYEGPAEIEADVTQRDPGTYTTSFILNVKSVNGDKIGGRNVLLTMYESDSISIDVGDTIRFKGIFEAIESTDDFDARSYYYSKGISARIYDAENLEIIGSSTPPLEYYFAQLREHIRRHAIMLSDADTGNLLSALILGERSNLDAQTRLDFTRIGMTHILALSGLHLSILALALGQLLTLLNVKKKLRYVITMTFIVVYMALTGFSVSVVRAGIMLIISYLLFLFAYSHDSITSLASSVLIICALTPYAIYDVALWLSAFATLGVIVAAELNNTKSGKRGIFGSIVHSGATSLLISVFAISATYFISVYKFGSISLISAASSVVFSFLTEIFMHIGTLMLIFGTILPVSKILIPISNLITDLASALSEPDWIYVSADYTVIKILIIALSISFFAFLVLKVKSKKRMTIIIVSLFVITNVTALLCHFETLSKDQATYYTADKSDIIFIKSESECTLVNSSQYSKGTAYLAENILGENNVTYLNSYVITHYSWRLPEHITTILSSVSIDNIYIPVPSGSDERAIAESILAQTDTFDTATHFIDRTAPITCGNYGLHETFRTNYNDNEQRCCIRIYKDDKICTYLSSGMLNESDYPTNNDIASSSTVIFGSYGEKYTNDIYIDTVYPQVELIISCSDGIFFTQKTYVSYKENGCEIYSHPQSANIYID